MDEVREATESLLEEIPGAEDDLRSVLAVDADQTSWTFDDIPLDPGAFGEIVSRGIVKRADNGYRVANRTAVLTALDGEQAVESTQPFRSVLNTPFQLRQTLQSARLRIDKRVAVLLFLVLALIFVFRVAPYSAVFRGENIVLSGNDPYAYRWEVEQMLARTNGPFDFGILSDLPSRADAEPLMVATVWWVTELLGGSERTAGLVLAWFPVASAILTGVFVYLLAKSVTRDRRVGLAAVSFLAIIPLHAIRTGVGFGDHHAFDYPWLVLTALALVLLADRDVQSIRTWLLAGLLGFAIAGQVLAWNNGVLLLVPVGIYIAIRTVSDIRANQSPLAAGTPVAGGIAFGALLVYLAHVRLGWHTDAVALVPAAIFICVTGVLFAAEGYARFGGSGRGFFALQGFITVGLFTVIYLLFPQIMVDLDQGLDRLLGMGGIAESAPLFSSQHLWLIGPFVFFGFVLFFALVYMTWGVWRTYRKHDPALLVPTVYAWYFFGLTCIQIRFAGEFSPFAAVFAGLGFVHLAWWVDLTAKPTPFLSTDDRSTSSVPELERPDRRAAMYTAGLWLGVGGVGAALSATKHSQLTVEDDVYEVATWVARDATQRNLVYPENYVFSQWDTNRVYNYFVSGESRSYGYAERNYEEFLSSSDPIRWYGLLESRTGYVIVQTDSTGGFRQTRSIHTLLANYYGSANGELSGTGHYRVRYVSEGGRAVFELVPGAVLVVPSRVDSVSVDVDVDGASFTYVRRPQETADGYQARVAYPGQYKIGNESIRVSAEQVRNGDVIEVS